MSSSEDLRWIGATPAPLQRAAILFVGVTAIMIAGLQPLLLGALAQEGRMTAAQLGRTATVELLTMGVAAGLAGVWLKPARLRVIGATMLLLLATLNAATPFAVGEMATLVRAAAGAPSGVLIWITIGMIARAPTPERWSGIYLTVQTLAQFLFATWLTAAIVPKFGADGGFLALAALCVGTAFVAMALPTGFAPLPRTDSGGGLPGARGWAALAATVFYLAFTIGVWVYVEPLSRQAGHAPGVAGAAVSISLACQVAGGLSATLLAGRLNWFTTILLCAVVNLGLLAAFWSLPNAVEFLVLSGAFGFLWLFVLPFLVPMVIDADPTRRAAVLLGAAQLLGGSFGPVLASMLVSDVDSRGALVFGAASLLASLAIMLGLVQTRSRSISPEV